MNIKSTNLLLTKVDCYFNFITQKSPLAINVEDRIIVDEINEKKVIMSVSRKLFSSDNNKILVDVKFSVYLDLTAKVDFNELKKAIYEGMPLLSNVFSRISVVISAITNYSLLGPVVTVPNYDNNKVIVESKQ